MIKIAQSLVNVHHGNHAKWAKLMQADSPCWAEGGTPTRGGIIIWSGGIKYPVGRGTLARRLKIDGTIFQIAVETGERYTVEAAELYTILWITI